MTDGNHNSYFVHTLLRAHNWQHRREFDAVCAWWRRGGRGVCALVGMGGAGKTAIAERFLRVLPGGLPVDPDVSKDDSLPRPHSAFAFSFYDAPNPEAFFDALQMWLEDTPRVETVLATEQLLFLLQRTPGLVCLDGLERVQEDGSRGTFGRLSSPKLRDFLDHLAAGFVPDLSVLVTSRFPLADLRDATPQFFQTIPIEEVDLATGVQLLKDRSVHGSDGQLEPIVEECGRHALTVDFAGGYIAKYGNGDPATPLNLGTTEELQAEAEQEADDEKRRVLKQGIRFARIAERYREAMLEEDEAAIALLERICLFRLGVECETLAAIFTGEDARKVSGKALAGLGAWQLQQKLNWLVRMRIVEKEEGRRLETEESASSDSLPPTTSYTIHPAVRDGFLSGIGREAAQASHEAVRQGLEVSLGDAPGENPSDDTTLDLLEEIVYHTIQSGHVPEAWDVYWNRIGAYRNLGWRLGAYERGERICRAFAGGAAPEALFRRAGDVSPLISAVDTTDEPAKSRPPFADLTENTQAVFINAWALYLMNLGRLTATARCYKVYIESSLRRESWKNASIGNQNLCDAWLLSGRLRGGAGEGGLSCADEALTLAERADEADSRKRSHAYRGDARGLQGEVADALADFRAALDWQHKAGDDERQLWSLRGIRHTQLLARLGRCGEATRLTEANKDVLLQVAGANNYHEPLCNLVLADLPNVSFEASSELCQSAREWAAQRNAKQVLCWGALVRGRIELRAAVGGAAEEARYLPDAGLLATHLTTAETAISEGLKIARDCGYGIFHIDLLLERARLHLLRGEARAALDDVDLALDEGIAEEEATGQPELLAANDKACGYAWGIAEGLHLRGEAQLLAAAQQLEADSFVIGKRDELPGDVTALIGDALRNLEDAMGCWRDLRDPEPTEDNNFTHPKSGEEYNFRAEVTWRVLEDVGRGVLTRHALCILPGVPDSEVEGTAMKDEMPERVWTVQEYYQAKEFYEKRGLEFNPALEKGSPAAHHVLAQAQLRSTSGQKSPTAQHTYDVLISYRRQEPDKTFARDLLARLETAGLSVAIDERDFDPAATFLEEMERCIKESRFTLAVASPQYFESGNCVEEAIICKVLDMSERRRRLIPLVIERVEMPTWLYNIVGIDFTDVDPLVDPHAKLIGKLTGS